ncbi:MAG: DUF2027 domain-containing protein [Muribaculaceae bacterium]|nr:DUF2027 domain-containing protein [Muribaculaceae bacterium]
MALKTGDTVRFLNSVGGGRVVRIEGQIAYVDEDGFETPALVRECVVVATGDSFYKSELRAKAAAKAEVAVQTPQPKFVPPVSTPVLPPAKETPEGEKLDMVLGFVPADIKRLSETSFDTFIVNDSNYSMYVTVATRPNESDVWTLRYAGFVEAQIQEFLFELTPEDLPDIDRIAVQALPVKKEAAYSLKPPVAFEQRLDATKFARLHCFGSNPYFDEKVLALEIMKDDTPVMPVKVNTAELQRAMAEKERDDRRSPRKVEKRSKSSRPEISVLEVDLHAGELLDDLRGLSASDILNYQIDTFRSVMDQNLHNHGRRIVFIHGKGEGVLRQALMKELNHRYKGHDVADASFREYGYGATQVTIK